MTTSNCTILGRKTRVSRGISLALITSVIGFASSASQAFEFDKTIENALKFGQADGKYGQIKVEANYRWENVNQDAGTQQTANANTIRLNLGYLTPVFHGLQGYVEYMGNYVLQNDYNNGLGSKPEFSTVADPHSNDINQLWLSYSGLPGFTIKGGRQVMIFDDQRFIGQVVWRQLDQTLDAVLATYNPVSLPALKVNVGYIGNVLTVLSTTENINAPIANVSYKVGEYGDLVTYGYWLGYTEPENYAKSNQSYGVRFKGKSPTIHEHYNLLYTAEWSLQKDYLNSPTDYQVDRFKFIGGFKAYQFSFEGGIEQLNGVGKNQRFITPLGLNHAYQGWADLFLTTPDNGIRDIWGQATAEFTEQGVTAIFRYHDFYDDTGITHYGQEYDASLLKKFGKHYSLLAKYAFYDADQFNTNTQKIWLQANVSF